MNIVYWTFLLISKHFNFIYLAITSNKKKPDEKVKFKKQNQFINLWFIFYGLIFFLFFFFNRNKTMSVDFVHNFMFYVCFTNDTLSTVLMALAVSILLLNLWMKHRPKAYVIFFLLLLFLFIGDLFFTAWEK